MENVLLVIHLLLALLLIGAVLLQRSEGGALGIGGGGGNVMSGRGAATALQKATWALAAAFIATSMILTLFAIEQAQDRGLGVGERPAAAEDGPGTGEGGARSLPTLGGAPAPAPADPVAPADPPAPTTPAAPEAENGAPALPRLPE